MVEEVLIFKSEPEKKEEKDPYQIEIENLGLTCTQVPSLQFKYKNLDILQEKLDVPGHFAGIVLTSPRVVLAISKCILNEKWKRKYIFAVGQKTKQAAMMYLNWDARGEHTGSGAVLINYILQHEFHSSLLIPCGNLSNDLMSTALQEGGMRVDVVEVYETQPHPGLSEVVSMLDNSRRFIGVFFSPSGVDAALPQLRQNNIEPNQIKWVAIGPTTALHMMDLGLKVSHVCEHPDPESVKLGVAKTSERTFILERQARRTRQEDDRKVKEAQEEKRRREEEKARQLAKQSRMRLVQLKAQLGNEEKAEQAMKEEMNKAQAEDDELKKEIATVLATQEGLFWLNNNNPSIGDIGT